MVVGDILDDVTTSESEEANGLSTSSKTDIEAEIKRESWVPSFGDRWVSGIVIASCSISLFYEYFLQALLKHVLLNNSYRPLLPLRQINQENGSLL